MDETRQEHRLRQKREASARWAAKNREHERVKAAAWRVANPDRAKANMLVSHTRRKAAWDEFLAGERKRYHANPRPKLDRQKAAKSANPDKLLAYGRLHYAANKPAYQARVSLRRAIRLRATPIWCDKAAIVRIYEEARRLTLETGIPHEVDHIIPLRGKLVCGLHIALNMQIITRTANRRKHNRLVHVGDRPESHQDRSGLSSEAAIQAIP
jgi:5-methylcytosine-specific restriction endonuclease McrA